MSNETVDEIWADDLLNRRDDAQLLFDFLVRRHAERVASGEGGAYVVNLAASWGEGKTFFLERLGRQMRAAGHVVAEVNAWRDDMTKEPMVAVMASIEKALKPHLKTPGVSKAWKAAKTQGAPILGAIAKGAAKRGLQKFTGDAIDEIQEIVENDSADEAVKLGAESAAREIDTLLTAYVDKQIKDYTQRIRSADEFQNRMRIVLSELTKKKSVPAPMFVLVDELDRCRPTYAIEMLEQIKHLFDIDNTIFILTTDGEQLEHSIGAVYGQKFDSKRYLHRFFHRRVEFASVETRLFVKFLLNRDGIDSKKLALPFDMSVVEYIASSFSGYKVSLREMNRCVDILRSVITMWQFDIDIQLIIMMPMIILYQKGNRDEYVAFCRGENSNKYTTRAVRLDFVDHYGSPSVKRVSHSEIAITGIVQSRNQLSQLTNLVTAVDPVESYWGKVFSQEWTVLSKGDENKQASVIRKYRNIIERMGAFDDLMALDRKQLRDAAESLNA